MDFLEPTKSGQFCKRSNWLVKYQPTILLLKYSYQLLKDLQANGNYDNVTRITQGRNNFRNAG